MQKSYTSLGLMSGTSGDGVDASLIQSNGMSYYESIQDKYYEYDESIYKKIHLLKEKINSKNDIKKNSADLSELEREITIFHAKIIKDINVKNLNYLIGFHGQTIFHNPEEYISYQLGDAQLLSQLTRKKIVHDFRTNDILNGGEGAPLTPIFHQLIVDQKKIEPPICILNIGGISNITIINTKSGGENFFSKDIGPGNCLIDKWVRKNSNKKFDFNGNLAESGKTNEIIIEQAQELYINRKNKNKRSFDVNDFDVSFARGLSLEDGVKTLTDFTANVISGELIQNIKKVNNSIKNIFVCGGGRKNKILIDKIQKNLSSSLKIKNIDDLKINGDFIESQAFAYLAIRSLLRLPISFPNTTGCKTPSTGGKIIDI
tara:strand:+ start:734 stop:1855 length:1122 start_codon:yes stop_codon:yes gene_type:complete